MPSASEKRQISWRGFHKISADLRHSQALGHLSAELEGLRSEMCL